MITDDKIREITARVFQQKFAQVKLSDNSTGFGFANLGFKIDCHFTIDEQTDFGMPRATLYYTASGEAHQKVIKDFIITYDKSIERAIEKAVAEFIEMDYSVLVKYYLKKEDKFLNEVKRLEVVSYVPQTDTAHAWEVFLSKTYSKQNNSEVHHRQPGRTLLLTV